MGQNYQLAAVYSTTIIDKITLGSREMRLTATIHQTSVHEKYITHFK